MADQKQTVQITVAGKSYRVVTSAAPEELRRLTDDLDSRVRLAARGKPVGLEAVVLAAITLAHELQDERARSGLIARRAKQSLARVVGRIDDVLSTLDLADPTHEKP